MPQARVLNGHKAQLAVHEASKELGATLVSVSRPGSQRPDVAVLFNGVITQFEVKNSTSQTSAVTPFSETVHRGKAAKIDAIIPLMTNGSHATINEAIECGKLFDRTVGFPGDTHAPSTGRLPLMTVTDVMSLTVIREFVIERLVEQHNTYLTLHCKHKSQKFHTYWTGIGNNVLGAPELPPIRMAKLATYGASPDGTMRVALKINFHAHSGHSMSKDWIPC